MKSTWFDGLAEDRKQELRGDFISSQLVRKRLIEIINAKVETTRVSVRKKENYEVAHFPALIGDSIGYERALMEIISLLES